MRGYRYRGSDVPVPPMRDYMIVAYRHGATAMHRRVDHGWSTERLGPGDVSLLTRAAESHWRWPEGIEVVHVYLTQDELNSVCRDMYGREAGDVELHDVLKADDPVIHRAAMLLAAEAANDQAGGRIRDRLRVRGPKPHDPNLQPATGHHARPIPEGELTGPGQRNSPLSKPS